MFNNPSRTAAQVQSALTPNLPANIGRALAKTNISISAALFDGRVLLGFLHDHGKRCSAISADHRLIGEYASRTAARQAITKHHQATDGAAVVS
jgi:hypothetical protein